MGTMRSTKYGLLPLTVDLEIVTGMRFSDSLGAGLSVFTTGVGAALVNCRAIL